MKSLNDDELSRYSRQILLSEVDYDGQLKLTQSHAVIVGLGGLGSPVSLYLAAAGVGTLSLIDFDNVDDSNLQRQIVHRENNIGMAKVRSAEENLKALNHFVDIFAYDYNLSEQEFEAIIEKADVVIDCTDNFSTRFMLNRLCYAQKKPLISGAAIRWEGQLSTFDFRKDTSPCYQCLYKEDSGQELTCSENGVLAPVVGMVGSIQAIEAIKALLDKPTLTGKLMILDAYTMNIRTLNLKKDPHCPICSSN
ncbi:HesA/MoeB/ThiF family protein [Hydrogenovibrio marinus]|uniref:HesA/MoeB/ThiF family protein n=1 Tax=Hydrogenovibrio marinus TaxID=28885 RepID=UPI0004A6F550|nr:molybdopterin-synthase adenylyltransferase MoeB [Hydrogenovibrio marinus]BBN58806.1 molybdopterin-synthase adenylyltransferase MoeB [Hydrogenovibrio marinus]